MPPPRSSRTKSAATPPRRSASPAQLVWLRRGLDQPGGKLPLFDDAGQRVTAATVKSCVKAGWAEPWFNNPLKPDWEICRLTEAGRAMLAEVTVVKVDFSRKRRAATTASAKPETGRSAS